MGKSAIRSVGVILIAFALSATVWAVASERASAASSTPVVYVATGENFPDALGAGPAAAIVKGPILLVSQNSIPGETAAELTRLAPDKIIIVGGTAVVSSSVESGLAAYAGTVERIAGANRYDTAAKLSAATYPATIDADTLTGKSASALTSDAFSIFHDAAISVPDTYGTVLKLQHLPRGNYVIIAKTYMSSSLQMDASCKLVASDGAFDWVNVTLEPSNSVPVSFTVVAAYAFDGGTAALQCQDSGSNAYVFQTKITAIGVDHLSNVSG